jgi:predicted dehydrogenase
MSNEDKSLLKIALVGCGQIADAHLQEIAKLPTARVVAVCDAYSDLARQAAERFGVPAHFDDMNRMLAETRPDVLHITTPAHTHAKLAIEALRQGVHVYVEKPFTLDATEAERVIAVAAEHGKQVCVGHDQLFDPIWLDAKRLIATGSIGDVTHVESVLGYPISGQFGSQVTADRDHWVHKLPGGLFQNTISHPLYRIADLMPDEHTRIEARWLRRRDLDFPTELVAHLQGERITGSLLFHTRIAPQRVTRVYGTQGGFDVDFDSQLIRRHSKASLPGAFAKIESAFRHWREGAANFRRTLWRFIRSDIHYFAGMKTLFEQFYLSIVDAAPSPIPPAEIVRVTRWMDEIFAHCREGEAPGDSRGLNSCEFSYGGGK